MNHETHARHTNDEPESARRLQRSMDALDGIAVRGNPRDGSAAAPRPAPYEPEPGAPEAGEWDRSGPELRWRQDHRQLVRDAMRSWKGFTSEVRLHMTDEAAGEPEPGSGSGKIRRAQARALMWEMAHHARPSPHPLYRGSHLEPSGPQPWSESRKVAALWAAKNGGRVFTLPKGTRGLRILDYTTSAFDEEKEWIVDSDGARPAA